jgi:GntR family transcriptional regulator, phosphonate transport system regulatory protein
MASMDLLRDSGVALWRQIEQTLGSEIHAGQFKPGGRFPTEAEIAERFKVHRHTARHTIAAMVQRGLLRIERGVGIFVEDVVIDYPIAKRTRFSANLIQQKREPGHTLLASRELVPPPEIASALKLKRRASAIVLDTIGAADGTPITASTVYFPAERFPGLPEHYAKEMSVTKVMRHYGVEDFTRLETRVSAELPSAEDARLLKLPRSRPVLVADSIDVDIKGEPISFNHVRFAGERVHLTFDFSRVG